MNSPATASLGGMGSVSLWRLKTNALLALVGAMVTLTFKKDYPNEGPEMSLKPLKGVTSKQSKELMEKLETQAQESLGMPMLFALTQTVKDWLDEQNMDSISKQKEAAKAQDELEMEKEKEVRFTVFKEIESDTSELNHSNTSFSYNLTNNVPTETNRYKPRIDGLIFLMVVFLGSMTFKMLTL